MERGIVAAAFQGLQAQGVKLRITHPAIGQGSILLEEGREVEIGRQAHLSQIKIEISSLERLLIFLPLQSVHRHLQAAGGEAVRHSLGSRHPHRLIAAHQEGGRGILQPRLS